MKHNLVKEGLLITTVLCLFLAMAGAASAAHSVTTERTISPTTVMAGDSFNVSVKIVITGPIENYKNISMATVKEDYSAVSDWPNWNISEGNWYADDPFDNVFRNGLSNESHQEALFEFSTEGEALYWLYSDGGTFYVNYTMTTSPNAAAGVQEIGGYYIDPDYSRTGYVGYNVYPTGDHSVTIERDPITSLYPSMTFAEIQDAFDQAEPGDTVYFNDGYYDLSGEGAGVTLDIPAGLTLTASSAENVVVDLGTDMQLAVGVASQKSGFTATNVIYSGTVGIKEGTFITYPTEGNTTIPREFDNLTDFGALQAVIDLEALSSYGLSDAYYDEYGSFYITELNGIVDNYTPMTAWFIYINGELAPLGLGMNAIEYGDVVTFIYAPYEYVPYDPYIIVDTDNALHIIEATVLPSAGALTIENLTFEGDASAGSGDAAGLMSSSGNTLVRNCVFNDVFLSFSDFNSTFVDNEISAGLSQDSGSYQNLVLFNPMDEGLVSGNTFDGAHVAVGYDGVTATSASNLVISDNTFTNATSRGTNAFENASLLLVGASNITVSGNEFSDNLLAVALRSFATYRLTDCTLYDNVFDSNDVAIMGFSLGSSDSGNRMYLNNFVGNTDNFDASDCDSSVSILYVSPASMDYTYAGGSYSNVLGNYYDDYAGADTTPADGIGDTPYATFLSGQDTGPLMGEWNAADNEISEPAIVAPVADFTADVTSGTAPLTVNFTDASTNAESWSWDFGDGNTSTDQNPTYTYSNAGVYSVNLTVSNSDGSDSEVKSDYITVTSALPVLFFAPGDVSVAENHYTEINITVSSLPEGLSGYNFTVTIDDPAVAEIVDIKYPAWANLTENSSLPGSSVYLKTADITSQVGAGEENIVLATITVSGNEMGSASLTLDVHRFDDDNGSEIEAELVTGTLEVTMVAIPGQTASPQDLDGDGFYEDLTGDGSFSFVDVEVFFHQMDWIEDNLLIEDFDLNENGRIDFDDIVDMFQMLD
jgi:PKD repeat protein